MKTTYLLIALLIPITTFSQMRVKAGNDTTFCRSCVADGTARLGIKLKIENGTPPYTYKWTAKLNLFGNSYFYAKSFLNDTTAATPAFKEALGGMDWYPFVVVVTDSRQQVARDTILVRFSEFYATTSTIYYFQNAGDEITLGRTDIGGGIMPYKAYRWSPTTGLSNPDSLNTKCKVTKSMTYTLTVTDSVGCTSSGEIYIVVPTANNIFAPKGTEWHYGFQHHKVGNIVENNYFHYMSVGDTLIANKWCNKIVRDNASSACRPSPPCTYVTQSNDTVFIYNIESKKFYPLYIWNAKAGHSWTTVGNVTTLVKSVKDTLLNNKTIRKYEVEYLTDSLNRCSSSILEGIGDTNYLNFYSINGIAACDEPVRFDGLRCYFRGETGLIKWSKVACNATFDSDLTPKTYLGTTDSWNLLEDMTSMSNSKSKRNYYLYGDTIINSVVYKSIYMGAIPDSVSGKKQYFGFAGGIREENRKWFIAKSIFQEKEVLLYDFNLKLGDTITVNLYRKLPLQVIQIDTIFINGEVRKWISFRITDPQLQGGYITKWIEGVGSIDGIFPNDIWLSDSGTTLVCYHHNNDFYYITPIYKSCDVNTAIETTNPDRLSIISDYRSGVLRVKCESEIEQIIVNDLRGSRLKNLQPMQNEATISLSSLPKGIYIVTVKTANKIFNRKIVVNR